jgi:hypothetical protein
MVMLKRTIPLYNFFKELSLWQISKIMIYFPNGQRLKGMENDLSSISIALTIENFWMDSDGRFQG